MARFTGNASVVMTALVDAGFKFKARLASQIEEVVAKVLEWANDDRLTEAVELEYFSEGIIDRLDAILRKVSSATAISDAEAKKIGNLFSNRLVRLLKAPFATRGRAFLTATAVSAMFLLGVGLYFRAPIKEWLATTAATATKQEEYTPTEISADDQQLLVKYLQSTGGALTVDELTPEQAQKLLGKAKAAKPVTKKGKPAAKKVAVKTVDAGPAGGDTTQPAGWTPFTPASVTLVSQVDALGQFHKQTGTHLTLVKGGIAEAKAGIEKAETALVTVEQRHDAEDKAITELSVLAKAMKQGDVSASEAASASSGKLKDIFAPFTEAEAKK